MTVIINPDPVDPYLDARAGTAAVTSALEWSWVLRDAVLQMRELVGRLPWSVQDYAGPAADAAMTAMIAVRSDFASIAAELGSAADDAVAAAS